MKNLSPLRLLAMGLLASLAACANHAKPVAYAEGPTGKDAYVFGFFTTQGAGGEQPEDRRTMGFRFDCSDKRSFTVRFNHETPLQLLRIAPGECSLAKVVYMFDDGSSLSTQDVPAKLRHEQRFEANRLHYLGDFTATISKDASFKRWQLTDAHHNYDNTTASVRREYPALAVLPVEDRMPGVETPAAPLPGLSPDEALDGSLAGSMPEAQDEVPTHRKYPPGTPPRPGTFAVLDPFRAGGWLGSGFARLRDQVAIDHKIGNMAPTLQLGLGFDFYDLVTAATAATMLFPQDGAAFQQMVENRYGEVSTASSGVGLITGSIAAGVRTPDFSMFQLDDQYWGAASLFARGGYAAIRGGREIANCVDCTEMTFAVKGGAFLESGLHLGVKETNRLGITFDATYRRYLGDASLLDEVQLGAGVWGW
jgi:hypothetical protein